MVLENDRRLEERTEPIIGSDVNVHKYLNDSQYRAVVLACIDDLTEYTRGGTNQNGA